MLAELRELRRLQLEQREALAQGDLPRLEALHSEVMAAQGRIGSGHADDLDPADRAEARALARVVQEGHEELVELASGARDAIGAELGELTRGRSALSGYRPAPHAGAHYLDRSG